MFSLVTTGRTVTAGLCSGHPRLWMLRVLKTWMPVIGKPTGSARSGRPDDKLRDADLRTAMPGGDLLRHG
jgi:hypothetical protein